MDNLYVYCFISRNKDNKNIEGFKTRYKSILAYAEDFDKIEKEIKEWAAAGVPGERTRFYRTLNARVEDKIRDAFMVHLIKNKPLTTTKSYSNLLTSIAMKSECRGESKWMFDFDIDDEELVDVFIYDIKKMNSGIKAKKYKTPNGYAIVVPHGFDTRNLLEKWGEYDITLKRDDLLFLDMIQKEVE